MKVKFLGETSFLVLTNGKIYDVMSVEKNWYRLIDESGEDYLYPPDIFEVVEYDLKKEAQIIKLFREKFSSSAIPQEVIQAIEVIDSYLPQYDAN